MCVFHCEQLPYPYTTQHTTETTVLIIFSPNLQTIIKAQMLSVGGRGPQMSRRSR